jgi:hypothetical protein
VDFLGSLPALIMLSADGRLLASSTLTEPLELEKGAWGRGDCRADAALKSKGTPAKLSSWIAQQATPDVARLTAASFANAELAALPMLLVFTPDPQPPPGLLDALREVAREFRGPPCLPPVPLTLPRDPTKTRQNRVFIRPPSRVRAAHAHAGPGSGVGRGGRHGFEHDGPGAVAVLGVG